MVKDFAPSDDPLIASPKFFEATPDSYRYTLVNWVHFSQESLAVSPQETKSMEYVIEVPKTAEPGDHFGAVFVSSRPPEKKATEGSEVSFGARVGSLILLTVSGDVKTKGEIVSFSASKKIFTKPPAELVATIKNSGNVHFKPSGVIKITGWSAREETLKFNQAGGNVLPASKRTFVNKTKNLSWGRYYAQANLEILSPSGDKFPLKATASFWILPLAPLVAALLLIVVVVFWWRRWLRRHDEELKQELKSKNG